MIDEIPIEITDNFKKDEYNDFVYNNPNASIFQSLEMAEVYERNKDTENLILVARNKNNKEILASLLAKKVVAKKGFLSSLSAHSTIRGGPIFKNTEDGIRATSLLLQEYNKRTDKWGPLYTRIHPLFDASQLLPTYYENGYKESGWNNFIIDLNKPVEEIWEGMSKSNKRNVKKAMKSGILIEEITEKKYIPIFYDLLVENYTKRRHPLEDISNFEATFDFLVPKGLAKFYLAKYKDEYIAGRLILLYKGLVYDWYAGSSDNGFALKPNDLLIWHILNWGAENGYHTFDFGGGGEPERISEGWVEFKSRFGGELVNYGRYTKVHQQKKLYVAKKGFQYYKKLLHKS